LIELRRMMQLFLAGRCSAHRCHFPHFALFVVFVFAYAPRASGFHAASVGSSLRLRATNMGSCSRLGSPGLSCGGIAAVDLRRASLPADAGQAWRRRSPWLRMADGEASGGGAEGKSKVPFREGDSDLFKAMAEDDAAAGNITGAATLNTIADRMQTIMDRSTAKMSDKLDVGEAAGDTKEYRWWPFINMRLIAKGRDIWVSSIKDGPKSARGPNSFEAGSCVSWKFRVNALSGPMCVGLTTLAVDLDKLWSLDEYFNEAFYITQNGNMYNGGQLIWERGTPLKTGDIVEFTLDADMVYVSVNDMQLPATLGPIGSSLRPTVQLHALDDGVSLLQQNERKTEGAGTATLERNKRKQLDSLDDDTSIISSLFSKSGPGASGTSTLYSSDGFSDGASPTDVSELSADEPLDIFALNSAPPASVPVKNDWQMLVADGGRVYYWNKDTNETSWNRPQAFLTQDSQQSQLSNANFESEAGRLLDKTVEDTSDVFFNNADGALDSHQTVRMDEDGYPMQDRFVHVDEETCIGCTNCATVARSTFFMTDEHGRARVFRQSGDSDELVAEAVDTCPVDCIWYVSWEDLVILENERKYQVINNQARLVSGSNIESTGWNGRGGWGVYAKTETPGKSKASIMTGGGMRCNNCPGRGCKSCPLYGVGENPEFARKKAARKAKKKAVSSTMIDSLGAANSLSDEIDLSTIFSDDLTDTDSFTDTSEDTR